MTLIAQKISDSKTIEGLERTVQITGIVINSDVATLDIYYKILYTQAGKDISSLITQQVPPWHIDNHFRILVRDENFEPILNPDYDEKQDEEGNIINENEKYMTMPAFDYIKMLMLEKDMSLGKILSAYITEQDNDGKFNF